MNLQNMYDLFDYVVFSVRGRSLTLGDLLWALLLRAGGWVVARVAAWLVRRKMAPRFGFSPRTSDLAPRWTFFLLWSLFILLGLRVLGIPLTFLNFLGGAIALGFGFGAQTLCSNLISGVIILIARPYRVGDIIEVNGQAGTVLAVGMRATEVLTYDGVNLVVPNASFLANTIVNRTNYERALRGLVTITAAYSADSRRVDELLRTTAAAHPAVINKPGRAPWVIFDNFGSNGLEFKLYFWVDTTRGSVAATASEIRHNVLTVFRAEGLAIPLTPHILNRPPAT